MGICRLCGKDMKYASSCLQLFDEQIPYGNESRTDEWKEWGGPKKFRCPDCGVKSGGYHHLNCEVEECPACHEQLVSCDCDRFRKFALVYSLRDMAIERVLEK